MSDPAKTSHLPDLTELSERLGTELSWETDGRRDAWFDYPVDAEPADNWAPGVFGGRYSSRKTIETYQGVETQYRRLVVPLLPDLSGLSHIYDTAELAWEQIEEGGWEVTLPEPSPGAFDPARKVASWARRQGLRVETVNVPSDSLRQGSLKGPMFRPIPRRLVAD